EPVGVEGPAKKAFDPSFFPLSDGKQIALLAINDVNSKPSSQIASASVRTKLGAGIKNARAHANLVVCLVHWGIENSEKITDEQRELGRWLIDRGVDLVIGSHPHCVQPLDFYHGRPIAYSLGNLVFDGAPTIASWNRGALLEVGLNEAAKISSVSLIPVVLEDGLPRGEMTEGNRFGSR
ncbi:MAG TPA: CapA family protein, partial [Pyrinomonadaceae bacterium]|nr:CapA family protein [Pyrinomonadaceae bacterium]